ncbi:glycosyltransferase [Celeribacter sp. ULVN23_4]
MMSELLLSAVATLSLSAHLGSAGLASARPWLQKSRTSTPPFRPHLVLIRPVKGLDPYDRLTLGSSFIQDYPDYEILFCAEHADDPACDAIRDMIADHPEVPAQLLVGESSLSANPKLNNVEKGVMAASGDWFVLADSNLFLDPDYLAMLADTWGEDVGLVSGPPFGAMPCNFWGAVECAFLNTNQGRWQLAADVLGIGFAQGKTLFWNRKILNAGGGLAALGRDTAEDVGSTKLVRQQGLRVRLPARLSRQPVSKRTAKAVWDRQLRWSIIRRDGFPALFGLEILQGPLVGLLCLLALALAGHISAALPLIYLALWYGAEALFARVYELPLNLRDLAAMMMRDVMLPALWVLSLFRRKFEWRGNRMMAEVASKHVRP